ncbi:MAG: hypothetical protein AAFO74_12495 [Pseudomonadota bacterium]
MHFNICPIEVSISVRAKLSSQTGIVNDTSATPHLGHLILSNLSGAETVMLI